MKILSACQFAYRGCTYQREKHLSGDIKEHEQLCPYRTIHCMAKHRGGCHWQGAIPEFMAHTRSSNCVLVMRNTPGNRQPFISFISDFGLPGSSVFDRTSATHWKPTLFAGSEITPYLVYLTVRRSGSGLWTLVLRTLAPKIMRDRIRVLLCVYGDTRSSRHISHKYSYRGDVVPHTMMNVDIMDSKKLLLLNDEQVRQLRESDGTLFHYSLSIDIIPVPPRALRIGAANGN